MNGGLGHNWYALQCPTGKEAHTRQLFTRRYPDLKILLPRRELLLRRSGKWHTETSPLFPGYLLVEYRGQLTMQQASEMIRQAIPPTERQFARFLGTKTNADSETPIREIHPAEITMILELCSLGEQIGLSHFMKEGNTAKIISGPLKGREGLLVSLSLRKKRARLKLTLSGKEHLIDMGIDQVSQDVID